MFENDANWLNKNAKYLGPCVRMHKDNYAYFHAHVYRVDNGNKPSHYYVVEVNNENVVNNVKKICEY